MVTSHCQIRYESRFRAINMSFLFMIFETEARKSLFRAGSCKIILLAHKINKYVNYQIRTPIWEIGR